MAFTVEQSTTYFFPPPTLSSEYQARKYFRADAFITLYFSFGLHMLLERSISENWFFRRAMHMEASIGFDFLVSVSTWNFHSSNPACSLPISSSKKSRSCPWQQVSPAAINSSTDDGFVIPVHVLGPGLRPVLLLVLVLVLFDGKKSRGQGLFDFLAGMELLRVF